MIPALLMVGAGIKMYNEYTGNLSQAKSEIENAQFYEAQAEYAREAMSRESQLAKKKYASIYGAQLGALAKGGVSVSEGSSIGTMANTIAQKAEELIAIRKKGELDYSLAKGRASQARKQASTLKDPFYNVLQASGTALTAYAMAKD
jgi:hypothetical protein